MPSEPLQTELIDRLVRYGLGQGEARCYVAMLAPRAFKVSEVARAAGLPRSRSYELIRSLVRSGLCSEVAGGRVARFRAAPPNEAIGRLEAFLAEQELRRKAALMTILSALDSRESGTGGPPGDEPVHMLRRTDRVYGAYDRLLDVTKEEVVAAVAMPWRPVPRPSAQERIDAGVRMRAVHERAVCSSRPHREFVGRFADQGVETRVVDKVDAQFSVFDRRLSILHLTRPKLGSRQLESLLINHAGLGQTLQQAFDCLWEQATPFDEAVRQASGPGPAGIGPDPRERRQLVPRGRDGRFVGYD
jgi:sugar-specific transcriptional regulator TrmB